MKLSLWKAGAAVAAGGALVLASAPSVVAAEPGETSSHQAASTTTEQQRVADYWSPERMRKAIPAKELIGADLLPSRQDSRGARAGIERGTPLTIGATLPDGVEPKAFPEIGAPWTDGGEVVQTSGRVFFTMDGQDASCSGNAVTSDNKSTVVTAGHCVKYQGAWHENWTFVPGYDNGDTPFGTWTAKETLTTPQWDSGEDMNYDVGAAVVNQLDGESLTDVVGGQGLAFNGEYNQPMYAFGFPAADPYDGEQLIYCGGDSFQDALLTNDHALDCNMTGGSSGGPWFLEFDEATGAGLQASVNSFGYTFLPDVMFGPYFGAEAQELYDTAQAS